MTREEEYYCTIRSIYIPIRDFIKWSKPYGLNTELKALVDGYITMIDKDVCLDLLLNANKFTKYLKEYCE